MLKKYIILAFNLILTIFICFSFFTDYNFVIQPIATLAFFLLNIYLLTSVLQKYNLNSWLWPLLIIFGIIIIPGSIIYYFYQLNAYTLSLMAIIISALSIFLWIKSKFVLLKISRPKQNLSFIQFLTLISYLFFIIFILKILVQSRTDIAVSTPWALIDKRIFILYFTATLILIIFFAKTKLNNVWKKILLSIHFFISLSVCWIVYKLGFGYDPFIHQKTVEIISQKGFILPKPLYYLGQYSLEVFLHKASSVSIDWIDKLLLPVLSAVYLPSIIIKSIKKINPIAVLAFLALPYSFLTFTTPQNLSLFFAVVIIFLSYQFLKQKDISWWWLGLLSFIALAIHPLSGLPILLFSIAAYIFKSKSKLILNKILKICFLIVSAIIVPLAFLIINLMKNYDLALQFSWQQIGSNLAGFFENLFYLKNNFRGIYDLIYFYGFNWQIFAVIFIIAFLIIFRKKLSQIFNTEQAGNLISIYIGAFLITAINYLILKNLFLFEQLIYYERSDYALRLIILMFLFLFPLIILFIAEILDRLTDKKIALISFLVLISLLITAGFYLSYPRYDNIYATHGVNVSRFDFQAAQCISDNSPGPYVVLANQNTSVAAVKLFGFTPVYNGHFYYPIPTGTELYQYFLKMVDDEPRMEYINQVKELTNVDTVYFVLPAFWNNFEYINEKASQIAIDHYSIDNQIEIYKF